MRILIAGCALFIGCATNHAATGQQLRDLTRQQRASFSEAGDSVTLSPTPDTGVFGQGDATHDCSSCPPR